MYSVRVRTRDIAIRMALGADPDAVRRSVTRRALRTVVLGATLGAALGMVAGRVISHQLFQVNPADISTVAVVMIGLAVVGWLAAAVPARQASRVSPSDTLREV
jgi:ABC-type antimicrobial peptide transport system permease subunit